MKKLTPAVIDFEKDFNAFGTFAGFDIATEMFGALTPARGWSAYKTTNGDRLVITCRTIVINGGDAEYRAKLKKIFG